MLARFFKKYPFTIIAISLGFLYWVSLPRPVLVSGATMGTSYTIKAYVRFPWVKPDLKPVVEARLAALNLVFSTYDPDSEVSVFNQLSAGVEQAVSTDFVTVFQASQKYHALSGGVFDPTVGPLLRMYGFGAGGRVTLLGPGDLALSVVRRLVGLEKVVLKDGYIHKLTDDVELDFSSIAKGYAVDEVSALLDEQGILHYYVEIGGELNVAGGKANGQAWRLGINTPSSGASPEAVLSTVAIENGALATSGTYRQVQHLLDGEVSHLIHPKTGKASVSDLVSVTVLAPSCMDADAMATFLVLMLIDEGLALVNGLEGVEALFIQSLKPGFQVIKSKHWPGP